MSEIISPEDNSRLMIAHFVDPLAEGRHFDKWPLHLTILPWFHDSESESIHNLEQTAEKMCACKIALGEVAIKTLGQIEMFGDECNIPVRCVNNSTSLGVIHGMLLGYFQDKLEDKTYIGGRYNPHVTIRENDDPGEGSEICIDKISLVKYDKLYKTVIKNFELLDEKTT